MAAAETRQPCTMCLRLLCILLAAVSGARGWGYCECRAQVQAGWDPGVRSLQGGSSRIAARWSRVPSPAGARLLLSILFCLSPALRNAAPRLARAPGPVLGSEEPRIQSAPGRDLGLGSKRELVPGREGWG